MSCDVRRAALALVVVSRLWSTTTLTPAILTGGLAAPATALALTPAGEQGQGEGAPGNIGPGGASPGESSSPQPGACPSSEAGQPSTEGTPQAPGCGPSTEAPPPSTEAPSPSAGTQPPSAETQPPNTEQPANVEAEPADTPPAQGAVEPPSSNAVVEAGGMPAPGDPGAGQAIGARSMSSQHMAHAHAKKRHRGAGGRARDRRPRHGGVRRARRLLRRLGPAAIRRTGGMPWRPAAASAQSHVATVVAPGIDAPGFATGPFEGSSPVIVPAGLMTRLSAPPRFLISIYKQAGRRYHVPWRVLAAINAIETDYGSDLSVSSQGAIGWMQFMPDTWRVYGAGGNPYDPRDAIFAAARLLSSAGASHDLAGAIYAYNHADWYVAAVLWRASTIAARSSGHAGHDGYALPLDARYASQLGRTDDGVDIETAPDGAPVYSITPGVVVAVANDPSGFGPDYPVILVTDGPLAGHYIYYGHVAASLVAPGQHVAAGEPIAIVGHTGDAADLGHGHIEIGFCDSSGDPLDHHGADAWTPSGQAMRWVLMTLTSSQK